MTKVALKGLLGRKLRAALTAIAIVLGVAMVSGTYVLTDTIKAAFTTVFTTVYKHTDAVITGKSAIGGDDGQGGNGALAPSLPESLLTASRRCPGWPMRPARSPIAPSLSVTTARRSPSVGRRVWRSATPRRGAVQSTDADERHMAGRSQRGRRSTPRRRARITTRSATRSVSSRSVPWSGSRSSARSRSPGSRHSAARRCRCSRPRRPSVSSTSRASSTRSTSPPSRERRRAHSSARSSRCCPTGQVRTGTAQAQKSTNDTSGFLNIFQSFLLAFGGVALFVGSFVIANTLSITIAQRTRELATLRTLGATRRQVLRSVMIEAFVIGLLASITGLFLGLCWRRGSTRCSSPSGLTCHRPGPCSKPARSWSRCWSAS